MTNFAFQSGKEETGPSPKARHAQTVFVIVILHDFNLQCSASPSILTSILMFMLLIFVAVGLKQLMFETVVFLAILYQALGLLLADGTPTVGGGKTF